VRPMSRLDEVGAADGWRCWLCDEPVDPAMSVNDPRGPSIDSLTARPSGGGGSKQQKQQQQQQQQGERLAHRGCNTRKGAVTAVVPWPGHLFVVDPAPILGSVDRLQRKGGREIMARCPTEADAQAAAAWLSDRLSRLRPEWAASTSVETGGGQHLVVLAAPAAPRT
jgi:hypothetical protein